MPLNYDESINYGYSLMSTLKVDGNLSPEMMTQFEEFVNQLEGLRKRAS